MVRQWRHTLLPVLSALPLMGLGACASVEVQSLPERNAPAMATLQPSLSDVPYVPNAANTATMREDRAIEPDELLGLKAGAIEAKLGSPALLRRDGPAQIWQYRGSGCIVDVFLYRTAAQDDEVTYVELRGPKAEAGQGPVCLGSIGEPVKQAAALR